MRCLVVALACLGSSALGCTPVPPPEAEVHLDHINTARAGAGLLPLTLDAELSRMAQSHACDMAKGGFFAHTAPDGSGLSDRARSLRLTGFCRLAENIARGQRDVPHVMRVWLRSPGHRANLLDPDLTHVGFGRAPGPHWVQVFGGGC